MEQRITLTTAPPRPRIRCTCRLNHGGVYDSCPGWTSGPDEPVCEGCVNSEHPASPMFDPIIKPVDRG